MIAIICEFNPFHNGHRYLIETARQMVQEPVLAVMSGSFTQRGEVAVCSKFERTEAALRGGADLVAELPAVYAVAAAQRFAQGGVQIASSFADVNYLAFGCETDRLGLLQAAAGASDHPAVHARIAEKMKRGAYYPQAAEQAVREVMGDAVADVMKTPNNILAVEYLRALRGTRIQPLPVRRTGAAHDSLVPNGEYLSASALRSRLLHGGVTAPYLPCSPRAVADPARLERAALYRLRAMTAEDFRALPEVGEGLEHRLTAAVARCSSVEAVLSAVKTKRYTYARLRRILCCAFLGITGEMQTRHASYTRVLGFTDAGAAALRRCQNQLVTSVAKALRTGGENADFLRLDILATDLAALAYDPVLPCGLDYHTKIIHLNRAQ